MKRETAETKISPPVFTYQTGVVKVVAFLQSMSLIARTGGGTETTKTENMQQDTGAAAPPSPQYPHVSCGILQILLLVLMLLIILLLLPILLNFH